MAVRMVLAEFHNVVVVSVSIPSNEDDDLKKNQTVEEFLVNGGEWRAELTELCTILRGTGLVESIKWGAPCYSFEGKNLVGVGGFKSYFGLWFFQGALLADKQKLLIAGGESTRAMRQMRFASMKEIDDALIRRYVKEAIGLVRKGIQIKPLKDKPLVIPPELLSALNQNPKAKAGFAKMTKSRQREYAEHILSAKQAATKLRRLKKVLPLIAAGGGLHDQYKNC